jgi:dipeptidyl aminopeptidase/acylaminoacyl peptidase
MRFQVPPARALLACLLALPCLAALAAAPRIPLETFAAGPEIDEPRLSPDGSQLLVISTVKGERLVVMHDLAKGGAPHAILRGNSGEYHVRSCDFKTNARLLCHMHGLARDVGVLSFPTSRLVLMNSDGSSAKVLFQIDKNRVDVENTQYQDRIIHMLPDDPHHVLLEMTNNDTVYPAVYMLNIDTGLFHPVVGAHDPVKDWLPDRDGVVRFGSGYRDMDAVYLARNGEKDSWRTLEKFKRFSGASFSPLAFGPLPNQLFVSATYEKRDAVWQMDLDEKKDFQLVFARPDVDVQGIVSWPTDGHVVGFSYENDREHVEYIDPEAKALDQALDQALPGTVHWVTDASRDGRLLVIRAYSDVMPTTYYLFDTAKHSLSKLGSESTALSQAQLAPTKPVTIPGPGGISIPGYLTLPVGAAAGKPMAAVVFPHGGPNDRDHWGYEPLLQLMANRGYAVLQLNFRGSTGYGDEWQAAGYQGWGTVMHDDITAGAHWLISQGIADPARMCIVGWSYGGYAALTGVVKEPQLYRCAVSIAGVSDLSQLADDDRRFVGGRDAARESTGTDKTKLAEQSPVLHADRIKVPVLLVHGSQDFTVRVGQSEAMASALERSKVPHELVVIKDGEHQLAEPSMRLTLYTKVEEFLAKNLGPP